MYETVLDTKLQTFVPLTHETLVAHSQLTPVPLTHETRVAQGSSQRRPAVQLAAPRAECSRAARDAEFADALACNPRHPIRLCSARGQRLAGSVAACSIACTRLAGMN